MPPNEVDIEFLNLRTEMLQAITDGLEDLKPLALFLVLRDVCGRDHELVEAYRDHFFPLYGEAYWT